MIAERVVQQHHRSNAKHYTGDQPSRIGPRPRKLPPLQSFENTIMLAVRYLPGGREGFLRYVDIARQAGDATAIQFFAVFHDLGVTEQRLASFDAVCLAGNIKPVELVKAIVGAIFEHNVDVGRLVAAAAQPDIVDATIRAAKRPDGYRDREMLLTASGHLPSRGPLVSIQNQANILAGSIATVDAAKSLPSFLADMKAVDAPKQAVQKQLIAASEADRVAQIVKDAELVEW
jgi:hypothetical protein